MKVAIVCPYGLDRPGGVQDQSVKLVEWLRADGHRAWLVGPGATGPPGAILVGRAIGVPANRSRAPVAVTPRAVGRALAAVGGADVVHVHEPLVPMVSLGLVRRCRLPMVGTFHADPGSIVRSAYQAGAGGLRRVVRQLRVITAVSPVAGRAVAPFADVRIIPNGVDTAAYDGESPRSPKQVVFIGRDEPRKGMAVLWEAWPQVTAMVPDARLVVVSDTIRTPPAGARIERQVTEAAKRSLLAESGIALAPNLGGESFGLVVAEAMAAGCAVVASGLEAFVTVLGDAGVLVAPGDASGLAGAVAALLTDPQRQRALGEMAAARAQAFDRELVTSGYLDAYREAID